MADFKLSNHKRLLKMDFFWGGMGWVVNIRIQDELLNLEVIVLNKKQILYM